VTDPEQLPDGGLAAAQIAVARAALRRLALPDQMAAMATAEGDARCEYAAGTLATIGRLEETGQESGAAVRREVLAEIARDWTISPSTGRSNSSEAYLALCSVTERLIREDSHRIVAGGADRTAALIVSVLAHIHHLAPAAVILAAARPAPVPVPDPFPASGEQVAVPLEALVTLLAEMDPWVDGGPAESAFRVLSAAAGVA
jgi:hypothetical protein